MPKMPPKPKPSPTKKSTTRRTGPSADAMASKASAKKKSVAKSASDAATRRFKVTDRGGSFAEVQDRVSGVYKGVSTNPKKLSQSKAQSETGYTRSRATNASLRGRKSYNKAQGDLKQFFGK